MISLHQKGHFLVTKFTTIVQLYFTGEGRCSLAESVKRIMEQSSEVLFIAGETYVDLGGSLLSAS